MNAKEIVVLPGVHEVLIDKCTWSNDASHLASILRSSFGIRCRIVEELIADSDMFVQVLDQYFEVAVKLVCRKASLVVHQYAILSLVRDNAPWILPASCYL
jgi:hypothetical protein